MTERLLVIVSELITEWIEKGEVVDRYYNPGDRFGEVHLLLTNEDAPDPAAVRRLAGSARIYVHNLPSPGLFRRTLGFRRALMRRWAADAVHLASEIRPTLIRCYGANLNGFCATEIRRELGIPLVVSLHTLPDDPAHPAASSLRGRVHASASRKVSRQVLRQADIVIAVYASLVPYLNHLGARRVEVAYNALGGAALRVKTDYALHDPVRVIHVGRQIPGKDPRPLIRGVAQIPGTELVLIGDGPLHESARSLVATLGIGDRVVLRKSVPNDEVMASLSDYDVFAAYNDYSGAPKAVLEPMLAGVPVVLNRNHAVTVPEFEGDVCLFVEGTPDGYRAGLERLIADGDLRERVGRNARARAERLWAPERAEQRIVDLYDDLLGEHQARVGGVAGESDLQQ